MPPKKKAGTKPKLDDDPENYRSHLRASLLKKNGLTVSREKQIDINQNIREIRAILKTNKEISDRCLKDANEILDEQEGKISLTFDLLTFSDVYASSGYIGGDEGHQNDGGNKIKILVHPIKKEKRFDTSVLFVLPEQLVGILEIPRDGDYKFYTPSSYYHGTNDKMPIDYIELFKQSLASLSDDVLTPFLVHLKDHLMTIQVCLGEIDQWIIESIGSAETCRQLLRDIHGSTARFDVNAKIWNYF